MESLAVQFGWGKKKIDKLRELLNQFLIIPIDSQQIVNVYVELDTFSRGKHPTKALGQTSKNTGKNDLWIAATTVVTGSKLITSDGDPGHAIPDSQALRVIRELKKVRKMGKSG